MQNEHGKLIASAAKAALEPLGCVRKGRSRVWYADRLSARAVPTREWCIAGKSARIAEVIECLR